MITHGHTIGGRQSRAYVAWRSMFFRCQNPRCENYPRYGGRGISVCDRWNKFENFLQDMGQCPAGKSLDRVDNGGNYEPGNCRWATPMEQQANTRQTRILEFDGVRLPIRAWARRLGIRHTTLTNRINKGWSIEKALTAPVSSAHSHPGRTRHG